MSRLSVSRIVEEVVEEEEEEEEVAVEGEEGAAPVEGETKAEDKADKNPSK